MTGSRRVALALCFAVGILEGFDIQIMGVAAPYMAGALGLGPREMSWIFLVSNLGLLIGASAGGRLADRHGRRPILIAASLMFGIFTLATAAAGSVASLLLVRVLAGLGLGAALPNLAAVASDMAPPGRRAFTTALMFCGVPLGGAGVALLTQGIAQGLDWRGLFAIGGILPLLIGVLQWRWLPESRPAAAAEETPLSASQALFGEGRAATTLLWWTSIAPTLMALYLILYWLPTLVIAKGLARDVASLASAIFNLAGVAGALALGRAIDRWGGRGVLAAAFAGLIAALAALAGARAPVAIFVLSAAAGFVLLGLNYAIYGLAAASYPSAARATGSGATVAAGRIGSVVGPAIPGFLLAAGGTAYDVIWLLAPAAALAGIAAVLAATRSRRMV